MSAGFTTSTGACFGSARTGAALAATCTGAGVVTGFTGSPASLMSLLLSVQKRRAMRVLRPSPPTACPAIVLMSVKRHPSCPLAEQREHVLRHRIRLCQDRRAGLLQDLRARKSGSFLGEVGVLNAAALGREVLGGSRQVGDRGLEAVLDRAERRAQAADGGP